MDFYDDIELSDDDCPKCGNQMVWARCDEIHCEDGYLNDEYMAFSDEISNICRECNGTGINEWCQKCGYGI